MPPIDDLIGDEIDVEVDSGLPDFAIGAVEGTHEGFRVQKPAPGRNCERRFCPARAG